ncbi:MAG: replication factor C small subunit [Gaeavirus sp.]|uniref:Replication factor C small subunit n=1 Tax=Gaeavirus sp. TaxID=2487767 RepID=A0A3G4ZZ90_9VIRU|nr:MAG: replication factor C small subunit [Gaeavirus sp.]
MSNNIEFLVDKYIPNDIEDIFEPIIQDEHITLNTESDKSWEYNYDPRKCFFHKETYAKLKKISDDDGMPHIIFYGNPGSGKKTMINLFLEMIFDKSIYKLDNSKYTVVNSGKNKNKSKSDKNKSDSKNV